MVLLDRQPSHGYELIRSIEELSAGFYVPSPGVIYPALTYLSELGHAAATPEGNRKLYTLTAEGKTVLEASREEASRITSSLERLGRRMDVVRDALEEEDTNPADELSIVRRDLDKILGEKGLCPAEERERIAAVLRRAMDEISRRD